MPFDLDFSEKLKEKVKRLEKKDKPLALRLHKKVKEIINRDNTTIDSYKNMSYGMSNKKEVHIGHFVLTFQVFKEKNLILFDDFFHHA